MHLLITDLVTVKARKDFYRILYINTFLKIMDWFKESRSQLKIVTCYMIQAKARSFANRAVYQDMYTNINAAKFSQKWVDSFMIRYNLVNRRKSTVAQRLPNDYVELQNSFLP